MSGARVALWAVLVLVAQLVDAAVLDRLTVARTSVDLVVLVVVAAALCGGAVNGAIVGVCAGLLADLTPPAAGLLGVNAIAYGLAGLVAGRWYRPGGRSADRPALLALTAAAAAAVVTTAVRLLFVLGELDAQQLVLVCALSAVLAVVVGAVVLPATMALDRRVGEELL